MRDYYYDDEPEPNRRQRLIAWFRPVLRIRSWRDAADLVMTDVDWSVVVMVRWRALGGESKANVQTLAGYMGISQQLLGGWPGHREWPSLDDLIFRDLMAGGWQWTES